MPEEQRWSIQVQRKVEAPSMVATGPSPPRRAPSQTFGRPTRQHREPRESDAPPGLPRQGDGRWAGGRRCRCPCLAVHASLTLRTPPICPHASWRPGGSSGTMLQRATSRQPHVSSGTGQRSWCCQRCISPLGCAGWSRRRWEGRGSGRTENDGERFGVVSGC